VVDFVLCRDASPQLQQDGAILDKLSDHTLLHLRIPITCKLASRGRATQPAEVPTFYKWQEGTTVYNYAQAGKTWAEHTDTVEFQSALLTIVNDPSLSNSARSDAVEAFLLTEAVDLGVVKEVVRSTPHNPNKWGKTLAPWFTPACREARGAFVQARRAHGRDSPQYREAA
jgi:hypothetical protein